MRELRDVAGKRADVVVGTGELHRDRLLGVELGHDFLAGRLEQLELQATAEAGLIDVRKQGFHPDLFGSVEQGTEGLLHVLELLPVCVEVDGLRLLVQEPLRSSDSCRARGEPVPLLRPVQPIAAEQIAISSSRSTPTFGRTGQVPISRD